MQRALVALAILCACVGFARRQRPPDARIVVRTLLDNYYSGRHAEAIALLRSTDDLRGLLQQFRDAAEQWAASSVPAQPTLRRSNAAVLFLEAGRVAIESPTAYADWRKDVEHYCNVLRTNSFSHSFQRLWLLTSVALLHGARDAVLLAGQQSDPRAYNSTNGHAFHALRRFADEPRFALAPIIVRREINLVANRSGAPAQFLVRQLVRMPDFGLVDVSEDRIAATIQDLIRLAGDERVGPEARLRLGILLFHLGRLNESAIHLQAAAGQSDDPFVKYLPT